MFSNKYVLNNCNLADDHRLVMNNYAYHITFCIKTCGLGSKIIN